MSVSAVWTEESCNHTHGSGFPRTIGSEKSENLTLFDGERKIVDDRFGSEYFGEIVNFNHSGVLVREVAYAQVEISWKLLKIQEEKSILSFSFSRWFILK